MIEKIDRLEFLKKHPDFPQCYYNEEKDEESFIYPEFLISGWYTLAQQPEKETIKATIKELLLLFEHLNFKRIYFLGDHTGTWLSRYGEEKGYYEKSFLKEAFEYFTKNGIEWHFNGAVEVSISELGLFLKHLYTLSTSDAAMPNVHFMDEKRSLLCCIHYSGQVKIAVLRQAILNDFQDFIKKGSLKEVDRKRVP